MLRGTARKTGGLPVQENYVCSSHQTVLSTRRHATHQVHVPILPPKEIQALWSQSYDTKIRTKSL